MSKPPFSKKRKGKTVDPYPLGKKGKAKSKQTKKNRGRPKKPKEDKPKHPMGFTTPGGTARYVGTGVSKKTFRLVVSADGGNAFSANWVKERVGESGNKSDVELANAYPGKIVRYQHERYRSGKEGFIEVLDPDDYSWKEIRGFKIFSRDPVDQKVRKSELRSQRREARKAGRDIAPRVLKSKAYKETLAALLTKHNKKELRKMYRLKYGSAPRLTKQEFAEQLAVSAYTDLPKKERPVDPLLRPDKMSKKKLMKVPVKVLEATALDLGYKRAVISPSSKRELVKMIKDGSVKGGTVERLRIVPLDPDVVTRRTGMTVSLKDSDGNVWGLYKNPKAARQARRNLEKLDRRTDSGKKLGKPGKVVSKTGVPSQKTLIKIFKEEWGWSGSAKMFKAAALDYQKAIKDGSWVYDGRTLTKKGSQASTPVSPAAKERTPKVRIKVSGERRVRKGATRRYTWKVYVGRKLIEEGTRSTREEARGAAEKAAKPLRGRREEKSKESSKKSRKRQYLGFTVPARGAEKFDPLVLSSSISPIRAKSKEEALELHAKALNLERYKIEGGYLYYTSDRKRMRLEVREE